MSATPTESDPAPSSVRKLAKQSKNTPSKIVVLKLPSALLVNFPSDAQTSKASRSKPPITVTTPSEDVDADDGSPAADKEGKPDDVAKGTETASTPTLSEANGDGTLVPSAINGLKRKGGPVSKADMSKRNSSSAAADSGVKPRGKPGPKRRKGIDGEAGAKGLWTAPGLISHKLGPKANQGDINARLRALDRSGAPCRKWDRKGLQLSSFTGVKWDLSGWKAPKKADPGFEGDVKSETTGSSDAKQEPASSNVASEKSHGGGNSNVRPASTADLPSSPAQALAEDVAAAST